MPAQYLPGGGTALTHGWSPRHIAACLVPARLDAQPALLLLAAPCSWEKKAPAAAQAKCEQVLFSLLPAFFTPVHRGDVCYHHVPPETLPERLSIPEK